MFEQDARTLISCTRSLDGVRRTQREHNIKNLINIGHFVRSKMSDFEIECFYCKTHELQWADIAKHPCFEGDPLLCLADNNVVSRQRDSNRVQTEDEQEHEELDMSQVNNINKTEWENTAVLLLIEEYRNYKTQLEKKNCMKRHIWQKITNNFKKHLYDYTVDQVQNKWKSLVRTYKNIKDHNNKSGRNRKSWVFFEKMNELLTDNPTIEPPLLICNGDNIQLGSPAPSTSIVADEELSEISDDIMSDTTTNTQRKSRDTKRKSSVDVHDLLKSVLTQNELQHQEEMQEKRRFNNLMEKLVNILSREKKETI